MVITLLITGLVAIVPAPDIMATGASAAEVGHPLAGADFPTLLSDGLRAGAAASMGGSVGGGGAWVASGIGGLSAGMNVPPFQDRFPDRALPEVAKPGMLRPYLPVAAWGGYRRAPWTWGVSARYGYLKDRTELDGKLFDLVRSESVTWTIGMGRTTAGNLHIDAAVGLSTLRSSVTQGSFVGPSAVRRLRFPLLGTAALRLGWPVALGRLVAVAQGGGGGGTIDDGRRSVIMTSTQLSWIHRPFRDTWVDLILGGGVEGWWLTGRRMDAELRQGVRVPVYGDHKLTVTAHEGLGVDPEKELELARSMRVGYEFDRVFFSFHAIADVEAFPSIIILGAQLKL